MQNCNVIAAFPGFVPVTAGCGLAGLTDGIAFSSHASAASLWAWGPTRKILVSNLNGNLVIQYDNGLTGGREFAPYGKKEPQRTVRDLIAAAGAFG